MAMNDDETRGISGRSLDVRLAVLGDGPVDLGAAARAELDWLSSDEFWALLQAQLDRITWEVSDDRDH